MPQPQLCHEPEIVLVNTLSLLQNGSKGEPGPRAFLPSLNNTIHELSPIHFHRSTCSECFVLSSLLLDLVPIGHPSCELSLLVLQPAFSKTVPNQHFNAQSRTGTSVQPKTASAAGVRN